MPPSSASLARDITAGGQEPNRIPTAAELMTMPLPDAFACVRAGLRNARRMLEAQLALAMEDEPEVRARRVDIIQRSAESETRLDAAEKGLSVSS